MAALQRIRDLVETIVYEAEGIDEELRTVQSGQLVVAARVFAGAVEVFATWSGMDRRHETK